jgi:FkbM family methyltransferase
LATALAKAFSPLQHVPLEIADGQTIYLDMRDEMCRDVLRKSPYSEHPWEPGEQAVIKRVVRRGDVVFDIGAHFGEHCVLLSSIVGPEGRVIAFEPNPERIDNLSRTVQQHGNGAVLAFAVSDASGDAVLFVPEFHVTASLRDWTAGGVGRIKTTVCRQATLDDLIRNNTVPTPDFVKCDVEGAELLAFKGARQLLNRREAPAVMYEANYPGAQAFGLSITASTDFLRSLPEPGYSIFRVQPQGGLVPVDAHWPGEHWMNLLAVPALRRDRLT